ncbi:hypothetical protein EYB26_009705 [Talaromyces marneffei]|uniref:uncharacterized protein n=1 Tax=Talaromyces marneffei TaxID=37727 RepID=UPI0012A9A77B|nr:uncharacterized protein EYB26_009705 [Talaromyces marneffei]QGA21991.1 hypothetical protein EYB26_009705 [Talaromyces marneffei]
MSYPPPYDNGQYPPPQYPSQYLHQIPQNAAFTRSPVAVSQSQPQYNVGNNVQYMNYTNSFGYSPASIPSSYPQRYGQPSPSQNLALQRGLAPPQSPQQQQQQQFLYQQQQQRQQQYNSSVIQQHQHLQQHLSQSSPQPPPQPSPQQNIHLQRQQYGSSVVQQHFSSPIVQQHQLQSISQPSPQPVSQPSPQLNQHAQRQQQYVSPTIQQHQLQSLHPSPQPRSQPSPQPVQLPQRQQQYSSPTIQLQQQLQQQQNQHISQPLPQPSPQPNQIQRLPQPSPRPPIQPSPQPVVLPSPKQTQQPQLPPRQQQQQPQLGSPVVQQHQNIQQKKPQPPPKPPPQPSPQQHQNNLHSIQPSPTQPALQDPPILFVNPSDTFTEPIRPTFSFDVVASAGSPSNNQIEPSFTAPGAPQQSTLPAVTAPATTVSQPASSIQSTPIRVEIKQEPHKPSPLPSSIPPSNEITMTPSRPSNQSRKSSGQSASPLVRTPQVVIPSLADIQRVSTKTPVKISAKTPAIAPHKVQKPQKSAPADCDVEYQTLLLALADEYLNAAHSKGTVIALSNNELDLKEYYKLVATGLGCLQAAQTNFRMPPLTEALTRLRYARILIEETDNDILAETALSKGIEICERNKLLDLKYTMQQLLARMLHKSNPKAAAKAVDKMIEDVETYKHTPWEYAFRLLRISLALASSSHQDFVIAIHNLQKLTNLATRNGDKLVVVVAALIEAVAHLQQSTSPDSVEQAQHAVAVARSHQLDPRVQEIPQIGSMLQMVDISCSLLEYDLNQASQKLQIMQSMMDQRINDARWREDGSFLVPLNTQTPPKPTEIGDILRVENGKLCLTLHWLPQHDLYALCYFLSSMTLGAKNSHDGRKAEKYLQEGLRMVRGNFKAPEEVKESVVAASKRLEWRRILYCNILVHLTFLACARTDWESASQSLKELRSSSEELGSALPESISSLMAYATGVIAQGNGDLVAALAAYDSPLLSLSSSTNRTMRNDPRRDTAILAGLNTILILREPSHPSHSRLEQVLALVEPQCLGSSNKYIQAAYYLVCATVHNESTIQTKQYLQQALQSATGINNSQITCMTLTFMSWKYFRGVVGEQSEKSARAGRAMAKKANDRLWVSVTDQMLAETLDRQGKADEARGVREEADRLLMGLPAPLKRTEYL